MVRVREARRAFKRFKAACFWSCDPEYLVTIQDLDWVAEQLMKHGGHEAWDIAARIRP